MAWPGVNFDGTRNYVDRYRKMRERQGKFEAARLGATGDLPTYRKLIGALNNVAGGANTPATQKAIEAAAQDIALVAPVMQVAAPGIWDALHGSKGSSGALASAIYNTRRHDPTMTPELAAETATNVMTTLTPQQLRGFSGKELGEMYQELYNRGMVPPDLKATASQLGRMSGPLSAVRDQLATQDIVGTPVADLFQHFEQQDPQGFARFGPEQLEMQIRTKTNLGGRSPYMAAAQQVGVNATPGYGQQSLEALDAQDQLLRQRAVESPAGQQLAATRALEQSGGMPADPNPQLGQDWMEYLTGRGMDPSEGMSAISNPGYQAHLQNPQDVDYLRSQQAELDLPELGQQGDLQQQAFQQQQLSASGYKSPAHAQQLHGPAQQQVPAVRAHAENMAKEQMKAPVMPAGPIQAGSDWLQSFKPEMPGV
jgi:hypothetical protein